MNNKNKTAKKFSFNFIDFIILLLVVMLTAAVLYVYVFGNTLSDLGKQKVSVRFTVTVLNIDKEKAEKLSEDNLLFTINERDCNGDTIKISSKDNKSGKTDLTITVQCDARKKSGNYYINGLKLENGEPIGIRFSEFNSFETPYISDITEINK